MIGKGSKARARKTAATKTAPRKKLQKAKPAEVRSEDVIRLEVDAARQQRSERAWLTMTAAAPDEDDKWSAVEEHLLARSQGREHSTRRWKYFSK